MLDALRKRSERKGADVLEVEPARGGGSYVLQMVRCGKPTCRCASGSGELHGPYWYLYRKKDGQTKEQVCGEEQTDREVRCGRSLFLGFISHLLLKGLAYQAHNIWQLF